MNETDIAEMRILIQTRLAELDQEDLLGKDSQGVVTLDQQSVGRLSRMDALQGQAMAKASQHMRNSERQGLQNALQRMKGGEFGYCDDCGDAISLKRLALNPAAIKCINCARS